MIMIFCVWRWTWSFVFIFVFVCIYVLCFCAATDFSVNKDVYISVKLQPHFSQMTALEPPSLLGLLPPLLLLLSAADVKWERERWWRLVPDAAGFHFASIFARSSFSPRSLFTVASPPNCVVQWFPELCLERYVWFARLVSAEVLFSLLFVVIFISPRMVDHTHTHTHTRLAALCLGLPGWAGTRKEKPIWILLKQDTVSGSGIRWAICKSAPRSSHITTPARHHSKHWRQLAHNSIK